MNFSKLCFFCRKKTIYFFLFFYISSSSLFSKEKVEIDGRIGVLFPKSTFREIYKYAPMYQIETSFMLPKSLDFWINFSYYKNTGRSIPLKDKTKVELIPLSLGLKYRHLIKQDLYFLIGLGPCYTWMRIKNDSEFVEKIIKKNSFGAMFKSSINYKYKKMIFLVFLDYYFQHFHFSTTNLAVSRHSPYVGGFLLGASIGINF